MSTTTIVLLVVLVCLTVVPAFTVAQEGDLQCHVLPVDHCAFAVDSNGFRCVLERILTDDTYLCRTSDIQVGEESPIEYIETDQCISSCGVERMTVGISTDVFSTPGFTSKLCASACRDSCENLADLYSNIVAGEGTTLAELCGEHRRSMLLIMSEFAQPNYAAAPGPAPAEAPVPSFGDGEQAP